MSFVYTQDRLCVGQVALADLATQFGTPLYVYDQNALIEAASRLDAALAGPTPHLVCYAIKANPSLAIIQTFARMGFGADVTSGGELHRALLAKIPAVQIVYSGVGKTAAEMAQALEGGIRAFHIESEQEIGTLSGIAASMGQTASVGLRVNPDIDPQTHPHIATGLRDAKFGLPWERIPALVDRVRDHPTLQLHGLSVHIGSQITDIAPFQKAAMRVAELASDLLASGIPLTYIDAGGGLGVRYQAEMPPTLAQWAGILRQTLSGLSLELLVEPGRALVAGAGVLVTRVLAIKEGATKTFVIVDAGMNDLLRPMLYDAYHPILPVERDDSRPARVIDIVGPVCESTDVLARERHLPLPIPGELLAIMQAGAYGMSMASNYNSRTRAVEVMVMQGGHVHLSRTRETYDDLVRGESLLPDSPA